MNQFREVRAKLRRRSTIIAIPVLFAMTGMAALTGAVTGILFALLLAGYWAPLVLASEDLVDLGGRREASRGRCA